MTCCVHDVGGHMPTHIQYISYRIYSPWTDT